MEPEVVLNPKGSCVGTCQDYKNPTEICKNTGDHCDILRDSVCADGGTGCLQKSKCPSKARRVRIVISNIRLAGLLSSKSHQATIAPNLGRVAACLIRLYSFNDNVCLYFSANVHHNMSPSVQQRITQGYTIG